MAWKAGSWVNLLFFREIAPTERFYNAIRRESHDYRLTRFRFYANTLKYYS
jgi:hypothetical protein